MNYKFRCFFLLALSCITLSGFAQYTIRERNAITLHGEWLFALDPAEMGIQGKWYQDQMAHSNRLDKVTVPHCFSVDPRYGFYTGTAWYRKSFPWKILPGKRIILHFDAAYYKTKVWLNNQVVGEHEGGYTPFRFDITDLIRNGDNVLAVSVNNNTWKPGTILGAKDLNEVNNPFVGWMNYGGLNRPVYLTIEPEVYAENIKIEAMPDLEKGTATLKTRIRIRNASAQPAAPKTTYWVTFNGKTLPISWKTIPLTIAARQTGIIESEATLSAAQVKLWNLDEPNLYQLKAVAGTDTVSANFGVRKIEVKNTQLLLNGKAIRAGGANRVVDYPGLGSLEPDWLIEKDFRLMKEAGMDFQRLTHYTPSAYFYDLADKYGMLIISEAGNWQLTPNQMDNDTIRSKFRSQFKEMAERDWNHPSIIAYSVGNEYLSNLPAGQRWTRDMIDYARELDPTRLYTFATMQLNALYKRPEDEASQYVDFICTNTYGNHARALDHIHKTYPDKPVLISEWGARADNNAASWQGKTNSDNGNFGEGEIDQAKHITEVMAEIRKRPYVIGASWWTYNDYQSRHYGTNPNGYRPWGLVRPDRTPRPGYDVYQKEMSPATVEKVNFLFGPEGTHQLTLKVTARNDFPAFTLKGYYFKINDQIYPVATLSPGESSVMTLPVSGFEKSVTVSLWKPTGFVTNNTTFDLK
jgi:beta-glucuronidase